MCRRYGGEWRRPKTDADRQFVADMTELSVAMLQAFNDVAYQLSEIVDRMDRMRP